VAVADFMTIEEDFTDSFARVCVFLLLVTGMGLMGRDGCYLCLVGTGNAPRQCFPYRGCRQDKHAVRIN
jgi:hypothetical protein